MDAGPPAPRSRTTRTADGSLVEDGTSGVAGPGLLPDTHLHPADALLDLRGGPVAAAPAFAMGVNGNGSRPPDGDGTGPGKALVLNATMEPLCVVPARRAVVLLLADKADLLHANGHRFRSERVDLAAPSVVRLRRYVHVPYRRRAALSRRGVFVRDHHTCQYCGVGAENVDHVVPRSRGGPHDWENVVASCRRCNSRKKDRTPAEAGMVLRRPPFAPRAAFWLVVAVGRVQPDWHPYLGDVLEALEA